MKVCVVAIAGLEAGRAKIEAVSERLKLPVTVSLRDPLDDSARCFSDSSDVFGNPADRLRAREITFRFGSRLYKKAPLGFPFQTRAFAPCSAGVMDLVQCVARPHVGKAFVRESSMRKL